MLAGVSALYLGCVYNYLAAETNLRSVDLSLSTSVYGPYTTAE